MKGKAGIAWYREADYPKLRMLFVDAGEFPESYNEWLDSAEEDERLASARGLEIVRVVVEPTTFAEWCKLRKVSPDAKARQDYARHGALRSGRPPKN